MRWVCGKVRLPYKSLSSARTHSHIVAHLDPLAPNPVSLPSLAQFQPPINPRVCRRDLTAEEELCRSPSCFQFPALWSNYTAAGRTPSRSSVEFEKNPLAESLFCGLENRHTTWYSASVHGELAASTIALHSVVTFPALANNNTQVRRQHLPIWFSFFCKIDLCCDQRGSCKLKLSFSSSNHLLFNFLILRLWIVASGRQAHPHSFLYFKVSVSYDLLQKDLNQSATYGIIVLLVSYLVTITNRRKVHSCCVM